MKPEQLRKKLGLARSEWARALNVTERTAARWEDGTAPQGLAADVIRGISRALENGADAEHVGRLLRFGIGTLLDLGFRNQFPTSNPKRIPT